MPRILISGASGLIGSALVAHLKTRGCKVVRLVRRSASLPEEISWNPMSSVAPEKISGFDAIIHLSGENVSGRWTDSKKRLIRESRVVSTRNLALAVAACEQKPAAFLCASAIGYYGDPGGEMLSEESPPGEGFLAQVTREWEAATLPASDAGIRTVNLRIGIVLSRNGGALQQMLLPFRLGLGAQFADGRQWWSWIHVADLISAVWHIANTGPVCGPVNMTAPNPVSNAEFTRSLAKALHRPAPLRIPGFAAKLLFGEFASEGLLSSARVVPSKLLASGFLFQFPQLENALLELVGNSVSEVNK